MVERTLVLIKPDAVERGLVGRILDRFEQRGLAIRAAKLLTVDRELAERHYAEHAEKPFFGELVEFITSSPTLALVLEGEGAIASSARRWGRRTLPALRRARSAATSRCRCRTTSSTARTRRSRPSARSRSGSRPMSSSDDLTEHARRNRDAWDAEAPKWVELGERAWAKTEPNWGIWGIPESELRVLPDVDGKDVIELGCGTAYWSAWLARRGARVGRARQLREPARDRPAPAARARSRVPADPR